MSDVAKLSMSLDDIIATHVKTARPSGAKGGRGARGEKKYVPVSTAQENKPARGPRKGLNRNRNRGAGAMDVEMDYGAPAPKQQKQRSLASAPALGNAPKQVQQVQRKPNRAPKTQLSVKPQVQKRGGGPPPRNAFEQRGGRAQVSTQWALARFPPGTTGPDRTACRLDAEQRQRGTARLTGTSQAANNDCWSLTPACCAGRTAGCCPSLFAAAPQGAPRRPLPARRSAQRQRALVARPL